MIGAGRHMCELLNDNISGAQITSIFIFHFSSGAYIFFILFFFIADRRSFISYAVCKKHKRG